jgi:hypothetical protein
MQAPQFGPMHQRLILFFLLVFIAQKSYSQNVSLINAFAHNDYWHKRPLHDALDNGFTQVEADIYLRNGKLIVAHFLPMLSHHHTLENLYLKPLQAYVNGGDTANARPPMLLMIDIKSDADKTYKQLEVLLQKYEPILSCYKDGVFQKKQLTIVLSGHKPIKQLCAKEHRLAFLDEDLMRVKRDTLTQNVYQMASCKYSQLLKWSGKGALPETQRLRLCQYVSMAHKQGERVRLWASPEKTIVWKELLSCGVDMINTDRLAELKNFLLSDGKSTSKAN